MKSGCVVCYNVPEEKKLQYINGNLTYKQPLTQRQKLLVTVMKVRSGLPKITVNGNKQIDLVHLAQKIVQVQSATALPVVFVYKDRNAIPIIFKIFRR